MNPRLVAPDRKEDIVSTRASDALTRREKVIYRTAAGMIYAVMALTFLFVPNPG